MQIQISWLLQKPTDLDLHYLLRQGMSCSAREGLKGQEIHGMVMPASNVGIHVQNIGLFMSTVSVFFFKRPSQHY